MAFSSFRDFVEALDRAGELIRIGQPVATELEITELANREMKSPAGGKAILIERPTINGEISPFPVAINTMGSWKRMAMSMGADSVDDVAAGLGALMKAKPPTNLRETLKLLGTALEMRHAKPKRVSSGPCKEVIHKVQSEELKVEGWPPAPDWKNPHTFSSRLPSLLNLPILKCWPLDGGRFITLPCVVTQDPDTGERNVGMYRIQIYDERTTGMHWQLQKVGARHGRR
ncbi:MAG: UbiD family decarboxylase domain-containing protein, partial [Terrimicrobiaceae bacterium]